MTRTEHLNAIVAKCRELLAMADGRTTGEFLIGQISIPGYTLFQAGDKWGSGAISVQLKSADAATYAANAAAAEAGWLATIAAIEGFQGINVYNPHLADAALNAIIAAWPVERLGVRDGN